MSVIMVRIMFQGTNSTLSYSMLRSHSSDSVGWETSIVDGKARGKD